MEKLIVNTITSNTDAKSAKVVLSALTIEFDIHVLNVEGRGYACIIDDVRIADCALVHLSVFIIGQSQCAWNARPTYVYTSESKATVWTVEALQSVSIRCPRGFASNAKVAEPVHRAIMSQSRKWVSSVVIVILKLASNPALRRQG